MGPPAPPREPSGVDTDRLRPKLFLRLEPVEHPQHISREHITAGVVPVNVQYLPKHSLISRRVTEIVTQCSLSPQNIGISA